MNECVCVMGNASVVSVLNVVQTPYTLQLYTINIYIYFIYYLLLKQYLTDRRLINYIDTETICIHTIFWL